MFFLCIFCGDQNQIVDIGAGRRDREASLQKVPIYFLTVERSGNCG